MPVIGRLTRQAYGGHLESVPKEGAGVENSGRGSDRDSGVQTAELSSSALYGLDHRVLNAQIELPKTMWMNMGYWKVIFLIFPLLSPITSLV